MKNGSYNEMLIQGVRARGEGRPVFAACAHEGKGDNGRVAPAKRTARVTRHDDARDVRVPPVGHARRCQSERCLDPGLSPHGEIARGQGRRIG